MVDRALPVFLINLDRCPERLQRAGEMLERAGISFARVVAADGRFLDPDRDAHCDQAACRQLLGRPMSAGEFGCYLSHLEAARQVLLSGAPHGLVFEDDITVGPDFKQALEALLDRPELASSRCDVVHLGPDRLKYFTRLGPCGEGHALVAAHYFPMTTRALLWSRAGARRFIEAHARVRLPVDFFLREEMVRSGRGLAVWPPLVRPGESESTIEAGRSSRAAGEKRWNYGFLKRKRLLTNRLRAVARKLTLRLGLWSF